MTNYLVKRGQFTLAERKFSLPLAVVLGLAVLTTPVVRAADPSWRNESWGKSEGIEKRTETDGQGRVVGAYFLSQQKRSGTIILFIQGSGCEPLFIREPDGRVSTTVFGMSSLMNAARHRVMVIEKPAASPHVTKFPGLAEDCPLEFNQTFSLESWISTIKHSLTHAIKSEPFPIERIQVIGTSEGATVAAALANMDSRISDVVLVGASGPSQYFDFIEKIHASERDAPSKAEELVQLQNSFERINRYPLATDRFIWGHTYKRWASFFPSSSIDNLIHSKARILLVGGMSDQNVPILSTEVLYAELAARRRNVTIRRIPFVGHDFAAGKGYAGIEHEFENIAAWLGTR